MIANYSLISVLLEHIMELIDLVREVTVNITKGVRNELALRMGACDLGD